MLKIHIAVPIQCNKPAIAIKAIVHVVSNKIQEVKKE